MVEILVKERVRGFLPRKKNWYFAVQILCVSMRMSECDNVI